MKIESIFNLSTELFEDVLEFNSAYEKWIFPYHDGDTTYVTEASLLTRIIIILAKCDSPNYNLSKLFNYIDIVNHYQNTFEVTNLDVISGFYSYMVNYNSIGIYDTSKPFFNLSRFFEIISGLEAGKLYRLLSTTSEYAQESIYFFEDFKKQFDLLDFSVNEEDLPLL